MSEERAASARAATPRARIRRVGVVGDDPILMLTGPIPATQKVLARAGLTLDDIDAFEVNEAFAPRAAGLAGASSATDANAQPARRRDRPRATRSAPPAPG